MIVLLLTVVFRTISWGLQRILIKMGYDHGKKYSYLNVLRFIIEVSLALKLSWGQISTSNALFSLPSLMESSKLAGVDMFL